MTFPTPSPKKNESSHRELLFVVQHEQSLFSSPRTFPPPGMKKHKFKCFFQSRSFARHTILTTHMFVEGFINDVSFDSVEGAERLERGSNWFMRDLCMLSVVRYCREFLEYNTESSLQGWRCLASLCYWLISPIKQTLIIQRKTSATQKYKKYDFCLLFPIYLTIGAILRCLNTTKKNRNQNNQLSSTKTKIDHRKSSQ